ASGPNDTVQCPGQGASLSVSPSGTGPFGYQWSKDVVDIAGATNSSHIIGLVSPGDAGAYCVVVTGAVNSVTNCVTLTVLVPTTASGPNDLAQCPGQSASMSVSASGTGPFSYQWSKDGMDVTGATNNTFSIVSVNAADTGSYCVVITGTCNSVTNCATLTVSDTTAPNVSCSAVPGGSVNADCQAPVPNVLGAVSASDDCSAPGAITLSQSPAAGTLVGLGTHTITVTASDEAGNSASCTTTFTVS